MKLENQSEIRRNPERGVALVVALLAIAVITSVGFALILSSQSETIIHNNFRSTGLALYAARGGLEEGRGRMGPDATVGIALPSIANPLATAADGIYIRRVATIDPTDPDCTFFFQNCADEDPVLPTSITYTTTAQATPLVPYAWTKITLATQVKLNRNLLDPTAAPADDATLVCWNWRTLVLAPVTNPTCDIKGIPALSPVYVFTSLAIEPAGGRRWAREIGTFGTIPPVPGPLTLDGPNPVFPPPSSSNFTVDGTDDAVPPQPAPAIGVTTNAAEVATMADICAMPSNRWGNYPGWIDSADADVDTCPPAKKGPAPPLMSVDNVGPTLDPAYQDCGGLLDFVPMLTAMADHVYTGPWSSLPDPGSPGNPVVNVVLGDASWNAAQFPPHPNAGTGILLVTGDLTLSGYPDYNGIIFVIGNGHMEVSGGGTGTINGGIFIANTSTCPASLGSPTFNQSGGGNFVINYNSDLTKLFDGFMPIRRISLNY
ncbi:MAG: pilus assembly PilX N-terminal domain-containing protein [Acidobacteria bacterium]|nr:pilus assembly PilX N-terminal domain-containing protein [Acidobacteriota bacterium]